MLRPAPTATPFTMAMIVFGIVRISLGIRLEKLDSGGAWFEAGCRPFAHRLYVASRAEAAAGAGQDDAADIIVVAQPFQCLDKA